MIANNILSMILLKIEYVWIFLMKQKGDNLKLNKEYEFKLRKILN